jgi:RNA-directed DNA polymerase
VGFLDRAAELLGKVDFDKSKIIQPQKLVFVCGGQKSGNPDAPTSMREILLARAEAAGNRGNLGGAKVILAEAAVNFLADSSFSNLLDLECFIAAVVHAVVLIVESPGSMCELGAFVMAPEICQKLIVVMQSYHLPRSSFITSGALKYFEEQQEDAQIQGYDWEIDRETRVITVPEYAIQKMLKELPIAMDRVHKMHAKEAFKCGLDGHLIYLTLAFCHLLRAAKQTDIKLCFEFANVDISETKLRHCLDILFICELLKPIKHSKLYYYVALVERMPLQIAFRDGTDKADRSTARWIRRIVDEIEKDEEEKFRIEMFKGRHNARHPHKLIIDCADHLALTAGELLSIANTAPKRYFVWEIPKRSGKGTRTVCHPARELKSVQYLFLREILHDLPVHPAATAYMEGSSIRKNAEVHVNSRVIMKLDFADFFNSLKVENWRCYAREHFPEWSEEELDFSSRILFWGGGSYSPRCLAIGAPTSPLISNALMHEVDQTLAEYAVRANLKYTRYADDITFSCRGRLNYDATLRAVEHALARAQFTSVRVNEDKTILVSDASARRVTGLMITPDNRISLGRDRKRLISAMVHRLWCGKLASADLPRLAGLLAFAADAEPDFIERLRAKYSPELLQWILRSGTQNIPD